MAETSVEFTTVEEVLKEAGFYHSQTDEALIGAIDGENKVFLTKYKPLYDTEKIVVLVNGILAEILEIEAEKGLMTLANAPAENAEIRADYFYSVVSSVDVETRIAEAQAFANSFMAGYDACSPYAAGKIPPIISLFTRLFAAGLLLTRDYGYNVDTELTSKDGYKKMQKAEQLLANYRDAGGCGGNGGGSGENSTGNSFDAESCGDIFSRKNKYSREFREDFCGDRDFDRGF